MSALIECDDCGRVIDTVDDPGAIIDPPECIPFRRVLGTVLCSECRERAWVRASERAMEEG